MNLRRDMMRQTNKVFRFRLGMEMNQTPPRPAHALRLAVAAMIVTSVAAANAQQPRSATTEPLIHRNRIQLTLAGAEKALAAAKLKAHEMGVKVNIAVVDDGGHLLTFARMEGARPASIYTSITKATAAATKRGATGPLPNADAMDTHLSLAVERAAEVSGGKFTTLKGGVPIVIEGQVIGAIGVGGAKGEEDAEVASAGVEALAKLIKDPATSDNDSPNPLTIEALVGTWRVADIAGGGVTDTTIRFAQNGDVFGSTGVNRYTAKVNIDGPKLGLQMGLATTRAAGSPALMEQEAKFLSALKKVTRWQLDESGLLLLQDDNGTTQLRCSRTAPSKD
ncbi:META domain protein [Fuerstiella marisgermanici]|uniref:META domain protein n=2 Tax=Fuerstiella marisgermanici TaxID=1891926 RepID=A0A1P8WIQ9_9PLAN|nr:META domain protein [Fuerstiella marisgermanici]